MKIGIKLVVYGALGFVLNNALALAPAINNSLAMSQMSNDDFSLIALNMMYSYEKVLWLGFLLVGILLFQKDIIRLCKKGINKDE